MKTFKRFFAVMMMAFAVISIYSSCSKSDGSSAILPQIRYVRVTKPEAKDSLLIGAGQGSVIAIVGVNLGKVTEIWFNDQKAVLTPTYITNTSVIVSVPNPLPQDITNKLKMIFSDGYVLNYDFQVQISKPFVSSMVSEFVNTGDIATIRGDYFYAPVTVTFTGGVTGDIVSLKDQEIQVKVPAGAQPGQITVKSKFGESKSNFWFRDNRNIFISSDPYEGWWNASYVVTPSMVGPGDPPAINGNYIRVKKKIGDWTWNEIAGGPASAMPLQSKNVPDAAILSPADYNLKFEVNTLKPYNASIIRINVALNAEDNDAYQWQPPYDTKGQWQTVIIPFEQIVASYKVKPTVNPNGYWTRLLFQGPKDWDADISFDNFRVVPKEIK
jgi:hypothetical protein